MVYDRFVTWESKTNDGQLYACCPLHHEKTPSFTVKEETGEFYCHGCLEGGAEKEFVSKLLNVDKNLARYAVEKYETTGKWIFPEDGRIDRMHRQLIESSTEMAALARFGITEETVKKHRLGWEAQRVIFPIFSDTGYCINLRKYSPPHRRDSEHRKMISETGLGKGSPRFYPYEAFEQDTVYIVEGEKDCMSARSQGINAVTGTGGANIPKHESMLFNHKHVYIMTDTDKTGQRVAKMYERLLQPVAHKIERILLPTKDFVEYYEQCRDNGEPLDVLQYCTTGDTSDITAEIQEVSVTVAENVENLDTWVTLQNITVVGTESKIYTVPVALECFCKNPRCNKPCALASSANTGQGPVLDIPPRYIVSFLDSKDTVQDNYAREKFMCKHVRTQPTEYMNVQKIIFQESASFVDGLEEASFEHRFGMFTFKDHRLSATARYDMEVCRVTDPRTQVAYYVIRDAVNVGVHVTDTDSVDLQRFRDTATRFSSGIDLLGHYYKEWMPSLGIEGRLDLFGAVLLTYCSVTEIPWEKDVLKGWLDTICIGDTRTGKSKLAQNFVKKLEMGSYINGENARRTGVIGGIQQFGGSWVVTWGAIPLNDRGLLVIDEASGLSVEDIKDLSSTRSSGAVTINKIVKGEARARTRLLWLSNPREGGNIRDLYWRGYGAFSRFIPAEEDQARFDLVLTAARDDIDTPSGKLGNHEPDLKSWRELMAMAWAIKSGDINISEEFEEKVREASAEVNGELGGGPLIVGMAVHEKLLRLTCAFGMLTGAVYNGRLTPDETHLKYAVEFLKYCLLKPSMGYGEFIKNYRRLSNAREENMGFVRALLTIHPVIKAVLTAKSFRGFQFSEILGIDKTDASKILSELIKRGLVTIHSNASYKPESTLIDIARQFDG